jgi:hypothetical protein
MSFFDSIFGSSPANQAVNSFASNQGIANSQQAQNWLAQGQLANAYNQQMMGQYQMYRNRPKWMYNGVECNAKEFAKLMWPDSPEEQMMFILKHGDE